MVERGERAGPPFPERSIEPLALARTPPLVDVSVRPFGVETSRLEDGIECRGHRFPERSIETSPMENAILLVMNWMMFTRIELRLVVNMIMRSGNRFPRPTTEVLRGAKTLLRDEGSMERSGNRFPEHSIEWFTRGSESAAVETRLLPGTASSRRRESLVHARGEQLPRALD